MLDYMGRRARATDLDLLEAIEKIRAFQSLAENWDGSGALPFDSSTLDYAKAILTVLADWVSVPAIYPESNGTVTFDWAAGEYQSLIEVGRTRFSAFIRRGPEALYLDQGPVNTCLPGAFIRMARVMQNYPVGERLPWPDVATGSVLMGMNDLLNPSTRDSAWTGQEPVGMDWLATWVHLSPPLLAR